MASRHVVVDGSNIATEGRSMPSLTQLDQAVREFMGENPDDVVTVVVDASFGHRIDQSEVSMYEDAEAGGGLGSPPAGVGPVGVAPSSGPRIDKSEASMYEEAGAAGERVSPPAGAIGRGDAFL